MSALFGVWSGEFPPYLIWPDGGQWGTKAELTAACLANDDWKLEIQRLGKTGMVCLKEIRGLNPWQKSGSQTRLDSRLCPFGWGCAFPERASGAKGKTSTAVFTATSLYVKQKTKDGPKTINSLILFLARSIVLCLIWSLHLINSTFFFLSPVAVIGVLNEDSFYVFSKTLDCAFCNLDCVIRQFCKGTWHSLQATL